MSPYKTNKYLRAENMKKTETSYLDDLCVPLKAKVDAEKELKYDQIIDNLVRDAARNWMAFEFEKIYRIILGSQIRFLYYLIEHNNISYLSTQEFLKKELKHLNLNNAISTKDWLLFPHRQGLIKQDVPFTITKKGLAFLQYLQDNEYNLKENQL